MTATATTPLPFSERLTWLNVQNGDEREAGRDELPDGYYTGNPSWVAGPFTSVIDAAEYLRDTDCYHGDFVVAVNRHHPDEAMTDSRPPAQMNFDPPESRKIIAVEHDRGFEFFGPADDPTNPAVAHLVGTLTQPWSYVEVKPIPAFITHPQSGVGHPKAEPCTPACSTPIR